MSSNRRRRRGGGQDEDDEPRPSRRRRQRRHHRHGHARKHLYLVLDDWKSGFSIYKIDPDTILDAEGQGLPEPPVLRIESPMSSAPEARVSFSALGTTKILVLNNGGGALVYDTETAAVSVGPHAPDRMLCDSGVMVVLVPAGGMVYALSHRVSEDPHPFHVMSWMPTPAAARPWLGPGGWAWKTLPEPPPACITRREIVVSHALHPDGRTIFMSTGYRESPCYPLGTFSFNTERSEWRSHGAWGLPFYGKGYFDSELDAWVGLHREGYVCCCQIPSRSRSSSELDWQMTKEKVAYDYDEDEDEDEKYGTASLTYMDTMGKFCVVETMVPDGVDEEELDYYCLDHQLRLTMFGIKYDRSGELRITNRRSTRSYLVPKYRSNLFTPFALWI